MTLQHPVRSIKFRKCRGRTLSIERGSVNGRSQGPVAAAVDGVSAQEREDGDDHDDYTDDDEDVGHYSLRKQDMIDTKHPN